MTDQRSKELRAKIAGIQAALADVMSYLDDGEPEAEAEPKAPAPVTPADDRWPRAVPESMIVPEGDPDVLAYRGMQIVEELTPLLRGVGTALDFGCGDGYTAAAMASAGVNAVGYDPKRSEYWDGSSRAGLTLTADFDLAASLGPYDFILLYDVLDHVVDADPGETLARAASALAPGGKMYVRFHPWTGRHGGHQYRRLNRAFAHLYYAEIPADIGVEPGWRVNRPLAAYDAVIKQAGLTAVSRKVETTEPEQFFCAETMERIIQTTWQGKIDEATARKIMANDFVDYVLERP